MDVQEVQVSLASEMMKTRFVSGSFSAWYILGWGWGGGDPHTGGRREEGWMEAALQRHMLTAGTSS